MATMRERVAERYPSLLPLLSHPEIGKLLTSAVQNNWSPGVFQSKFIASKWFRTQPEAARRWWVLSATDPAEMKLQLGVMTGEVAKIARQLGVPLPNAYAANLAKRALQRGLTPDSYQLQYEILHWGRFESGGRHMQPGAYQTAIRQVSQLAEGQYFRSIAPKFLDEWGTDIVLGRKSMDDLNAYLQKQAMTRFPHMKEQLAAGASVAEIVAPFVEIYAEEMDRTPGEIMTWMRTRQHERNLFGLTDPKTRQMRLPTEADAIRLARQTPSWWGTTKGRQNDAAMSSTLLKAFGKRV